MTAMDRPPLSASSLVARLLPGVALTTGQMAQMRAIDTRHYTELFALRERARSEGREWSAPSPEEARALRAALVAAVREMLDDDQRAAFDRNLAASREEAG